MQFAINYSPQAAELVESQTIEIDFFKTPPWPDMIAQAERLRPVKVHFDLRAGTGNLEHKDWGQVEHFLASTATAFVNVHLGVRASEMPEIPVDDPPTSEIKAAVAERILRDLLAVTAQFGPENVIAENIPYRRGQDHDLRACAETDLIAGVIREAGCGLLLDVSHARIAAQAIGSEEQAYIRALPVNKLRELHFTGIHDWDGFLMDHLPVLEADWPWLVWIMDHNGSNGWGKAEMLAFEYGGTGIFFARFSDPEVIRAQVPRLFAACHNRRRYLIS